MAKYFLNRILILLPKLIVITIIIFIGIKLMPGDPITYRMAPEDIALMDPQQLALAREKLGLNDPLYMQYFKWITSILSGDFGYSYVTGVRISTMLESRMYTTIELAGIALLVSTVIGVSFGFISAIRQNSFIDYFNTIVGMIGISVPAFFFGLIGIWLFALKLHWLPTGGRLQPGQEAFFSRIEFLVLPCVCLGISLIATLMRYTRSSMLDIINKDYIRTVKSKGVSNVSVYIHHGLRNALTPIIIVVVSRLSLIVSGTVVIESVFNYPGLGTMLITAINSSDMPIIMITTLMIAVCILVSSLLSDLLIAMLDPRVRFGQQ